ncbi:MAG: hypothetical protein QXL01_04475 [Thermoplasmatales archaeon]
MKIMVIPDGQVKPNTPLDHWTWAGKYAADKRPDVIVNIGDWADMESLSSYDKGKKSFEGRRYNNDIAAITKAVKLFEKPIEDLNERLAESHKKRYTPRKIITLGNHEERILRVTETNPEYEGIISLDDLPYKKFGWEVYQFLDVVIINGVAFSHYFVSGVMNRPITSPAALCSKKHMSCVMGHVQKEGIHTDYRADGKRITGIFAGSFYMHDEQYLGPQGNNYWRGVWMLHNVRDGDFDVMPVSLEYLRKKYGR